jgi:hypothetical protein
VVLADGRTLAYTVKAAFIPVLGQGLGLVASRAAGRRLHHRLHACRRHAWHAAGVLRLQRRAGLVVDLAAPGRAGAETGAVVNDDASLPRPPYAVVDNPLTWLDQFDLVFIDPPHTGWSVSASEDAAQAAPVGGRRRGGAGRGDARLADRHRPLGAPLYLAGESYGTTRGAALADKLQTGPGVPLSGIWCRARWTCRAGVRPKNDLPYALFLPAFAATAQYHGALAGPLGASGEAARAAAEAFVASDYLAALHAGARLTSQAFGASPAPHGRIDRAAAHLVSR